MTNYEGEPMTNNRELGDDWLEGANEEGITPIDIAARSLAALAHFVGALLDLEEEHQSDKFEASPLRAYVEHDDDNPDTLAEDDADTIARPIAFGSSPLRADFYGSQLPWGAA